MESSAENFLLQFDISATEEASYTSVDPLNLDFDQGESLDSWFSLASTMMNNEKCGLDPTWSTSIKLDKSDAVCQFILSKEFATGSDARFGIKIVNLLKGTAGKEIGFTGIISGISYNAVTEEVLQVDFDIKIAKASTFTEADYVAPSV